MLVALFQDRKFLLVNPWAQIVCLWGVCTLVQSPHDRQSRHSYTRNHLQKNNQFKGFTKFSSMSECLEINFPNLLDFWILGLLQMYMNSEMKRRKLQLIYIWFIPMPTCTSIYGGNWLSLNHNIQYLMTISDLNSFIITAVIGRERQFFAMISSW